MANNEENNVSVRAEVHDAGRTLVFCNGTEILRTTPSNLVAFRDGETVAVGTRNGSSSVRFAFKTEEESKQAFLALAGPVGEIADKWPAYETAPAEVEAGSSAGTSADPVDELAGALGSTLSLRVLAPSDPAAHRGRTVSVSRVIRAWLEEDPTGAREKTTTTDAHVELVSFNTHNARSEHDKILLAHAQLAHYFESPVSAAGREKGGSAGTPPGYEFAVVTGHGLAKFKHPMLSGRIDLVARDRQTGRYVVVDLKTAGGSGYVCQNWLRVENIVQLRLYALMLRDHLKLGYVPDAYILKTTKCGDDTGGPHPIGLWRVTGTETMRTYQDAFAVPVIK